MGADMHWRVADLNQRRGLSLAGRAYVLVELHGARIDVHGPFTRSEATREKQERRAADQTGAGLFVRKLRGPLVELIENDQP